MEKFIELLNQILNENKLIKATLSSVKKSDFRKIEVRPFKNNEGVILFQLAKHKKDKVFHVNLDINDFKDELIRLMENEFSQLLIKTTAVDHHVFFNKDKSVRILSRKNENIKQNVLSHNKVKNYIFKEGEFIPFLYELGIINEEGTIFKAKYDKFKQINRFIEYIEDVVDELSSEKVLKIIDFGCGKSYLTFAIHHYLTKIKNLKVDIIGLDLKDDVIRTCNLVVSKYNLEGIRFEHGDIATFKSNEEVDLVVSLHACNTATDYALYQAIKWSAKVIMAVPCCHHELNAQITSNNLSLLVEYGIVKERVSALMTDVIRSTLLELQGYKSQIIEFIDLAHTPKNLLIRAIKHNRGVNENELKNKIKALKGEFNFNLTLEKLLKITYDD